MPGLGSLAAGLRPVSSVKRGEIYIVRANDDGAPDTKTASRKFQYFPQSLSDSKSVTYQEREVPGGSLPIYQYTNSGARTIAFTAFFSTDVDHLANSDSLSIDLGPVSIAFDSGGAGAANDAAVSSTFDAAVEKMKARLKSAGATDRNVFIPGALMWLRQFMLPRYETTNKVGTPITFAPRKLWLVIPNSGIGGFGGAGGQSGFGPGIFCHMTQCDITYDALFPSGNIRHATVSLAFAENPQAGGIVRFPSFNPTDPAHQKTVDWYTLTPSGGRK